MERAGKRQLIFISVIAVIAIAFAVILSYVQSSGAWFFDKDSKEAEFERINFDVDMRLNDKVIEQFTTPLNFETCTTLNTYTPPVSGEAVYDGDKYFNSVCKVIEIKIKNTGALGLRPKFTILFQDDYDYPEDSTVDITDIDDYADMNVTKSGLRAAILLTAPADVANGDFYSLITASDKFSMNDYFTKGAETDGRIKRAVLNRANKLESQKYNSLSAISSNEERRFSLVVWMDYDALVDIVDEVSGEQKYAPRENMLYDFDFEFQLIIEAVDEYAPIE